jgi:hypothetical protein
MKPVYVFGLTTHSPPPLVVNGHRIDFIDHHGVHAAIELGAERPSVSEAALRSQHDIVMRIFAHADDLLPVRFGAWVEEHELIDLIETRRAAIAGRSNWSADGADDRPLSGLTRSAALATASGDQ